MATSRVEQPSEARTARRRLSAWAVLSVLGALVVSLPDTGPRLFSLSPAHGPSAVDALGIVLALAGWATFLAAAWHSRDRVRARVATPGFAVCAFTLGLGLGLVVASVSVYAHWWAVGVVLLGAAHLLVASWLNRG